MKKARKKLTPIKRNEYIFATILLIYPIVMFCIFAIYGQYLSITQAFQKVDMYGKRTFLPWDHLFDNFKDFIDAVTVKDSIVWLSIYNSLKNFFLCFVITNPLYLIFAYFVAKKKPGAKLFTIIAMMPEIISGLIFSLIFKKIVEGPLPELMNSLGAKNFPNMLDEKKYAYGITLFYRIWVGFGSSTIIFANALSSIEPEIFESAKVDGCVSMFQEIWHIGFPLIYPMFSTLIITGLAGIFSGDNGLVTFYMYGAPPEAWNLGYYFTVKIYNTTSPVGYPMLSAGGLILTLILTPLCFGGKRIVEKLDPTV